MGSQHVDAAAMIHAFLVRFIPRALGNIDHTGQNARRDAAGKDQCAALIVDFDFIAIFDSARGSVNRVGEHSLREGFLEPVIVVMRGMDAVQGVMSDGL